MTAAPPDATWWRSDHAARAAVAGLFLTIAVVSYHPQTFGPALFPWDWQGRMSTGPSFVSALLSVGDWPAWVPFQGSGAPAAPDIGSGLYYPVHWLTGLLGIPLTADLQATIQVLHVAAGGLGVTALARARGLRWGWSTVAGLAFLFFGGFSGQATHMHHVRGFALTPWLLWASTEPTHRGGRRLTLLPLLAWLVVSGAYPGQLPILVVATAVYGALELRRCRNELRRPHLVVLGLVAGASVLAVTTVLWPYLSGDAAGLLHRPVPPSTGARARQSMEAASLLGLVADPWTTMEGGSELQSWSVGIPVVVGLAGLRWSAVRRHLPVLLVGATGLAFMLLPRMPVAADLVLTIHPSRFPFADAKSLVAVAFVLLAAVGWSGLGPGRRRTMVGAGVVLGVGLVYAAGVVPTGRLSDTPWVLAAIVVGTVLTAALPSRGRVLLVLVALLVVADGWRVMADQDFEDRVAPVSPWEARLPADELAAREDAVRALPGVVASPPPTRPARVPPFVAPTERASGNPRDAIGYLGQQYNVTAYGGFVTEARWEAVLDPEIGPLLELPWQAWVVDCDATCRTTGTLPPVASWVPTDGLSTTSYGLAEIDYRADFDADVVVVENEIAYPGWDSSSNAVEPFPHDGPLRAWAIAAGQHTWTATYSAPSWPIQGVLASLTLLLAVAAPLYARRATRPEGPTP